MGIEYKGHSATLRVAMPEGEGTEVKAFMPVCEVASIDMTLKAIFEEEVRNPRVPIVNPPLVSLTGNRRKDKMIRHYADRHIPKETE